MLTGRIGEIKTYNPCVGILRNAYHFHARILVKDKTDGII